MEYKDEFLVSVIVPVYNVIGQVDTCIISLVKQTYGRIEIILVDDGSTDGSGEILEDWKAKDSRIKVIHTLNAGVTAARKRGWMEAKGEYCLFVDGDDSLVLDAVAYFVGIFRQGKYDFVSGAYDIVYAGGKAESKPVSLQGEFGTADYIMHMIRLEGGLPSICIGMFKTSLFDDEIFNIRRNIIRGEDVLTLCGVLNKTDRIYCSDKVFYHYYQREDSVTHRVDLSPEYMLEIVQLSQRIVRDEYKIFFYPIHLKMSLAAYYAIVERDGWCMKNAIQIKEMLDVYPTRCEKNLSLVEKIKYAFLPFKPAVVFIVFLMKVWHIWRK